VRSLFQYLPANPAAFTFSVVAAGCLASCGGSAYRQNADNEVGALLQDIPEFGIEANESSRLRNPATDDFPPIPRDDSAARSVSEAVLGKDVYPDGNPATKLESDTWRDWLPLDKDGQINLNLPAAVKLALTHSPDFQREKEDLYLSALDVTYERFRLDPKPFLDGSTKVARSGASGDTDGVSSVRSGLRGVAGAGTSWVASVASQLTFDLSNGATSFGGSLANLTLTRPLLRGAGKRIYRERLSQAERTLLVDARRMEQFRQGFFLDVVTGGNPVSGPSRGGGGFASTGLVAGFPSSRTGASGVGGFFGLLQSVQGIRNQEANVAKLRDSLAQLDAAFDAGRIGNRLQVDQARQALYNAQSSLLASKAGFETRLDGFKMTLGLPPDLPVKVDASYVDRFRLTDPNLAELQEQTVDMLNAIRDPLVSPDVNSLRVRLEEALMFYSSQKRSLGSFIEDRAELRRRLPQRKEWFLRLRDRSDLKEAGMSGDAFRDKDLDAIAEQLELSGERLTADFTKSREDMETLRADLPNLEVQEVRSRLAAGLADFSGLLLELSLARASARLEAIVMEDVRVEAKEALEVARERRLDWMNARAKLVDVWRDAALARDDLRSDLDLVLSGDVGSNRSDAGHFKADEGRLSFGLQFDTPLSKLAERNDYREALINYQRARRDYLAYQDGAYRSLRNTARIARLSQLNFELARSAVRGAIAQVDLARLRLQQPPQPGKNAQFGATTARDLVNALNDLLDASNAFLQVWVGYEALRMRLDFELGTMRLNEEGLWLDPGPILARKFMSKEKNEPMPAP
jgi:hypothetical protein